MNGWGKVILIFFTGWFGVHKFVEGKVGMGILYLCTMGLFGIGWLIDLVQAINEALNESNGGSNGFSNNGGTVKTNVILTDGENCYYCQQASFAKTKNVVVGYTGGGAGASVRVAKGLSLHTGSSAKQAIRRDVVEKYPGLLTITNKRVVFSGTKGSFDKSLSSLSAVTPYKDAVAFQFGNNSFPLIVRNVNVVTNAVEQAVNNQ